MMEDPAADIGRPDGLVTLVAPALAEAPATPAAKPAPAKPSRRKASTEATQPSSATAPRPVSPEGYELDEWSLPRVGPARIAALGNRTDPNIDPTGWRRAPAAASKE